MADKTDPQASPGANSSVIRTAEAAAKKRIRAKGTSLAGLNATIERLRKQRAVGLITEREQVNALNNYGIPKGPKKAPAGSTKTVPSGGHGPIRSTSPLQRQRLRRM